MGYVKKGSAKSAVAGGSVAIALLGATYLMLMGGSAVLLGQRVACGTRPSSLSSWACAALQPPVKHATSLSHVTRAALDHRLGGCAGATTFLAGFMGQRAYRARKFMPSGLVCVLALAHSMLFVGTGRF
jgi:uncharacterized membrane protein (UPF0136 family)